MLYLEEENCKLSIHDNKINIQVYNWGPCVIRVKISDTFKKLLLDESKKNKLDYENKLAGILYRETGYTEESKLKGNELKTKYNELFHD